MQERTPEVQSDKFGKRSKKQAIRHGGPRVLIFLFEKSLHYDRTLVFVLPLAQVLCCCVSQNKIHVSQCLNKDFGVLLIWP